MIVAIHQPHYLPWLGYLHRMAQADLFVVLDHVQFERRNRQNRSQIRLDNYFDTLTNRRTWRFLDATLDATKALKLEALTADIDPTKSDQVRGVTVSVTVTSTTGDGHGTRCSPRPSRRRA